MNYEQLAEKIWAMTDEQRSQPVMVATKEGPVEQVDELVLGEDVVLVLE